MNETRNEYIAFILGLIGGGLGQLYNGHAWYVFFIVNFVIGFISVGLDAINEWLFLVPALVNAAICGSEARQINRVERVFHGKSILFYPMLILTIFVLGIYFGIGLVG